MKPLILLFACLFFSLQNAFSQAFYEPAIVVLTTGDTLKGFARNDPHDKLVHAVLFKKRLRDKAQILTPDSVKSFVIATDQYFEAHAVYQKSTPSVRASYKRYFLRRVESGFLRVLELDFYGKRSQFLQKQGDSTLYPLVVSIRPRSVKNNPVVDTLTVNSFYTYMERDYIFGTEYLATFYALTQDWRGHAPKKFVFEEDTIEKEVKLYNAQTHPRFKPKTLSLKARERAIFTVGIMGFTPVNVNEPLVRQSLASYRVTNGQPLGYELLAGINGWGRFKRFSLEGGIAKTQTIASEYTYSQEFPVRVTYQGEKQTTYENWQIRANYTLSYHRKISLYAGVGYAQARVSEVRREGLVGLGSLRTDDQILLSQELFFAGGVRAALGSAHIFRAEIDYSPKLLDRPYGNFFRVGYQYRFRL